MLKLRFQMTFCSTSSTILDLKYLQLIVVTPFRGHWSGLQSSYIYFTLADLEYF